MAVSHNLLLLFLLHSLLLLLVFWRPTDAKDSGRHSRDPQGPFTILGSPSLTLLTQPIDLAHGTYPEGGRGGGIFKGREGGSWGEGVL